MADDISPREERALDLVVFGATGFTGQLIAKYLASQVTTSNEEAVRNLKWGLGGRSKAKLEELREKLGDDFADLPLIVADSDDYPSLERMVRQTRVVITAVGPFMKYGGKLVEACVKNRTDYVDTTGETPFIRDVIEKYDEECRRSGVLVVNAAGYDSQPSDFGVVLLADYAQRLPQPQTLRSVETFVEFSGTGSGGTLASVINLMATANPKDVSDVYLLNPPDAKPDRVVKGDEDQHFVRYNKDLRSWTSPFLMAGVNTRVVRRSQCLLQERQRNESAGGAAAAEGYGRGFQYAESQRAAHFLEAVLVSLALLVGMVLLFFRPTRWFLTRGLPALGRILPFLPQLPQPGEGPGVKSRARSWFHHTLLAKTNEDGRKIWASVSGGEPGYNETAKMISEAALALALERADLPAQGGVATPAAALGLVQLRRLQRAGLSFFVVGEE